jgi:hypothetical protein
MSQPTNPAPQSINVVLATQTQILNEQRVVVLKGRAQFALEDTVLAIPFGLLKHLAGSLQLAEGKAELARAGATLQEPDATKVH